MYVSDSEARKFFICDVLDDTFIANMQQFAYIEAAGYADRMKVDTEGHLFATGPIGVWVYNPNGAVIDIIMVPGQTKSIHYILYSIKP